MHTNNAHSAAPQDPARQLKTAINTARAGDKAKAREMLLAIAETDPTQENVWLWLAGLAEDLHEAKAYLETILALNPHHQRAKSGLDIVSKSLAAQEQETARQPKPTATEASDAISRAHENETFLTTPDTSVIPAPADPSTEFLAEQEAEAQITEDPDIAPSETVDVNAEITPSFSLSVEQAEAIDAYLETIAYESEADSIILADVTGQLISERGETSGVNTQVLSALAAGELSATQEMARLVGEEARFSLLLHEGERRSVYVSPVGAKMLLIVVFASQTPIGLVRIILKKAVDELNPILSQREPHGADVALAELLDGDCTEQLEDEISASLDIFTN